jgi:hypothetical protein
MPITQRHLNSSVIFHKSRALSINRERICGTEKIETLLAYFSNFRLSSRFIANLISLVFERARVVIGVGVDVPVCVGKGRTESCGQQQTS